MGQSGAGKTTLLNIMTLLERPDEGEIHWNGQNVTKKSNSWLAKQRGELIGLVFQSFYLIPELNVLENVLMARRLIGRVRDQDRDRAMELLTQVGLKGRLFQPITKISGGESQRVAIARALMNQPKVIVADEPTGNLDENTAGGVMELLLALCNQENTALILVTHNPEFANKTEKKVSLHLGNLTEN